jgi:hypothetical protein
MIFIVYWFLFCFVGLVWQTGGYSEDMIPTVSIYFFVELYNSEFKDCASSFAIETWMNFAIGPFRLDSICEKLQKEMSR